MTKEAIIQKTVQTLTILPADKVKEISDYADYILHKYEELVLNQGIQNLQSQNESFSFLNEEEPLYTKADIKVKF